MSRPPRARRLLPAALLLLVIAFAAIPVAAGASAVTLGSTSSTDAGTAVCGTVAPGWAHCLARFAGHDGHGVQPHAAAVGALTAGLVPADLASAYGLATDQGAGKTVAIVDAYDDPSAEADLGYYRSYFGLGACTTVNGCFRKVDQNGGTAYPAPDAGWATEISLDLDMVSATCPRCSILLVEASDSYMSNIASAVNRAVAMGASVVSLSLGGAELPSETAQDPAFNHPGVSILASSGDNGYGVEYPAASPYVTAVGGTSLTRTATTRGWSETAWSGAGSGCSAYEPKPAWQLDTGCSRRTVADVSAVADPNTPVYSYDSYAASGWLLMGGTSVAAPVLAGTDVVEGLAASGAPAFYHGGIALNDVVSGSNGSCSPAYLCTGMAGYDGPTGMGTPAGAMAGTTTTLTSTSNPSTSGQPVTLTATLSPPTGPTGTVTFLDGGISLGTVAVSSGTAGVTVSALALDSHSLSAIYSGDLRYNGSTSAALAQTVTATTTTALTSSSNPSTSGLPVTLTATLSPPSGPTGTVTFLDGAISLGTAAVSGGTASLITAALPVGGHSLTALYAGDGSYVGSTSAVLVQTVTPTGTAGAATALNSSLNPSTSGLPVTLTATLSPSLGPTGAVTFLDGAALLGYGTVSGGTASLTTAALTAGSHVITAMYSGDPTYSGSTSPPLAQTVRTAAQGFIVNLYHDALGRGAPPPPVELSYWTGRLQSGDPRYVVATSFVDSSEAHGFVVDADYLLMVGRASDPAGRAYWVSQLNAGVPNETIIGLFGGSAEYHVSPQKGDGNNLSLVLSLYTDILRRTPTLGDAGVQYWLGWLDNGHPAGQLATQFADSHEYHLFIVNGWYQHYLGRLSDKPGAEYWATYLDRGHTDDAGVLSIVASDEYDGKPSAY